MIKLTGSPRNLAHAAIVAMVCVCGSWAVAQEASRPKETPAGGTAPVIEATQTPAAAVPTSPQPKSKAVKAQNAPTATYESAPVAQPPQRVRVFRIRYCPVDNLVNVLARCDIDGVANLVADNVSNTVLAKGSEAALDQLEKLLDQLDSNAASPRGATAVRFRVVWLAAGLPAADGSEPSVPAEDLKGVIAELAAMGFNDVRQVTQSMVNTQSPGEFSLSCSTLCGGNPATLTVGGTLTAASNQNTLALQAQVQSTVRELPAAGPESSQPTRELQGTVERNVALSVNTMVRQSKYTVLGVTPSGKITSFFVVQVIPVE